MIDEILGARQEITKTKGFIVSLHVTVGTNRRVRTMNAQHESFHIEDTRAGPQLTTVYRQSLL